MADFVLFQKNFLGASSCESFSSTEPTARIDFVAAPWIQSRTYVSILYSRPNGRQ
jgi:hypothetical protein